MDKLGGREMSRFMSQANVGWAVVVGLVSLLLLVTPTGLIAQPAVSEVQPLAAVAVEPTTAGEILPVAPKAEATTRSVATLPLPPKTKETTEAEAEAEMACVITIGRAAQDPATWQAAAWMLERRWQDGSALDYQPKDTRTRRRRVAVR